MAPTRPDLNRVGKPTGLPWYAKDVEFCRPLNNNEIPIPFRMPSPMRTRVSAHRVDNEYIDKYHLAVQLMKSLPDDDPRNFFQQASIHCAYCNGAYLMENTDKQFNVHSGWFFLPWHRWFLYFHERILADLLKDDTFALPFWNWDYEQGMTIPPMYLDDTLSLFDEKRNPNHHKSTIVDLGFNATRRKAAPPLSSQAQVGYNYRLMYKHVVSLARTTRAFHGAQIRKQSSSCTCAAGMLEIGPHNLVHDWIGSPVNKSCPCRSRTNTGTGTGSGNGDSCEQTCHGENMGILYSAARDPIFYAHHANIDRLWTVWKTLHGREDYRDPSLLDTRFFFYDENKLLVSVRAGDAFDPDNLRYNYQRCPTPWIHKPKYIDKPTDILLHGNPSIPLRKPPLDFTEPVKILVDRRFPEEQLLIEGIRVQRNIAVKFDIFINLDDALLAVSYVDTLPREFAGTFHEAPQGTTADVERGCGQSSLCVGISEVLSDLNVEEEETSIVVTLVPKVELEEPIKISDIRMV
ncbi:hypothetical protein KI387_035608 [Taxus chinensis]|uniref:Tyrosinase copper-binding domain-containing protein n=1 Tax=Taxus chinensis TaxID=29808 RepID=A0AA38FN26_TAXCH|nr:hypothetical protein KI387_035608 [Taxus chinensis]